MKGASSFAHVACVAFTILAAAMIAVSCSGGSGKYQPNPKNPALAELKALEIPEGVDPGLFQSLKAELERKLKERIDATGRIVANAPTGNAGRVTDLAYDLGTNKLSWSYVNVGDYDCNGEVSVADITPIALNFGAIVGDGIGNDAYEAWVDGDKSGEVGISDITPIAMGYLNAVAVYDIITSDTENGNYSMIGSTGYPSPAVFPVTFSVDMPAGSLGWVRVQPLDWQSDAGEQSNAIQVAGVNQPPVASFDYTQQPSGFIVDFDASNSGDSDGSIVKYEWDWDNDGTYDFDAGASPAASHDYVLAGNYDCTLRVTDNDGDTGIFTKTVYVLELATNWTLVDPFALAVDYSLPACAYIGTQSTGEPAIAFYTGNFNSGCIAATDGYGATWGTVTTIDTYLVQSMALADIGGFPAMAFNDYTNDHLNYVRATDAAGTTWGAILEVDTLAGAGRPYIHMLEIAGNPAIAYYNNSEGTVNFVRSSDQTGNAWLSPIVLHPGPPAGPYPTLAVVNFRPAVAFTNNSPVNPRYVRSLDPEGTSWTAEVDANSDGESNGWTSLVTLETSPSVPAIAGCARGSTAIMFYRATDTNGTAWEAPIVITEDANLGLSHLSAAIVGGFPCIAYNEYNLTSLEKALVFKQALRPDGSVWSAPVYVQLNVSPEDITLLDARGRPAICYYVQNSPGGTHYAYSPAP